MPSASTQSSTGQQSSESNPPPPSLSGPAQSAPTIQTISDHTGMQNARALTANFRTRVSRSPFHAHHHQAPVTERRPDPAISYTRTSFECTRRSWWASDCGCCGCSGGGCAAGRSGSPVSVMPDLVVHRAAQENWASQRSQADGLSQGEVHGVGGRR